MDPVDWKAAFLCDLEFKSLAIKTEEDVHDFEYVVVAFQRLFPLRSFQNEREGIMPSLCWLFGLAIISLVFVRICLECFPYFLELRAIRIPLISVW